MPMSLVGWSNAVPMISKASELVPPKPPETSWQVDVQNRTTWFTEEVPNPPSPSGWWQKMIEMGNDCDKMMVQCT